MEDAPIFTETSLDLDKDTEKDKSKKKSKLGLVAVESKSPERKDKAEAPAEKPRPKLELLEAEPVSEEKAPSEKLSREERTAVLSELAQDAKQANSEKLAADEANPEAAAAELAANDFLSQVENGADPDEAAANTFERMGVDIPEPEESDIETEQEIREEEENLEEIDGEEEEVNILLRPEASAEEGDDEEEVETPAASSASAGTTTTPTVSAGGTGTPPPPVPPVGLGGPGGPGGPPHGPVPPFGPGGGFNVPGGPGGPTAWNPNAAPAPVTAPNPNTPRQPEYHDANPATMALFGGIIGYLIGRRRGRIKTEKKLIPIQKKLEKQVTNLQFELQEKEKSIRRVAAEKVRQDGPTVLEVFTQKTARETTKDTRSEVIDKPEQRKRAPEAHQLHGSHAKEHIGHMLMAAEASNVETSTKTKPEKVAETRIKMDKKLEEAGKPDVSARRIETMNRTELLSLSEKIVVEGSTLRQIYETNLIGERGLRRLITEHLRGGDIKKALRQEIVEREIDFERDPILRDMAASSGPVMGGGKAVLDEMLAKAAVNVGDSSEEAAFFRARAAYEAKHHEQAVKQRQVLETSLIATILILVCLVFILIISRT